MAKITLKSIAKKYLAKGVPVEDFDELIREWFIENCSEEELSNLAPFPIKGRGKVICLNSPDDKNGELADAEFEFLRKDDGDSWEGIWVRDCGEYVQIHDDTCGLHFTAFLINI